MAAAQPSGTPKATTSGVEEILGDLSTGSVSSANAFRTFIQRAQLVITGLIHVSVLLLPKLTNLDKKPQQQPNSGSGKGKRGGSGSHAGKTKGSNGGGNGASGSSSSYNDAPVGMTADGSDINTWNRVNSALERHSASGMDWSNSCVYEVAEDGTLRVAPVPDYGLAATAAFQATRGDREGIICNDYDTKGPHFADWEELATSKGARSMAAAPMYYSDRLVGVLTLASSEPHAFERSRVVWLLAMALAPFVAGLRYAVHAVRIEAFIARIMPPLLKQNYMRTTGKRNQKEAQHGERSGIGRANGGGPVTRKVVPSQPPPTQEPTITTTTAATTTSVGPEGQAMASASSRSDQGNVTTGMTGISTARSGTGGTSTGTAMGTVSGRTSSSTTITSFQMDNTKKDAFSSFRADSAQFAEHAEVLIATPSGRPGSASGHHHHPSAKSVLSSSQSTMQAPAPEVLNSRNGNGNGHTRGPATNPGPGNGYAARKVDSGLSDGGGSLDGNVSLTNGHLGSSTTANGAKNGSSSHAVPAVKPPVSGGKVGTGTGTGTARPASAPPVGATTTTATATTIASNIKNNKKSPEVVTPTPALHVKNSEDLLSSSLSSSNTGLYSDPDLDWGDFIFNLISMCIVYAYFSDAAVGGESQAAVGAVSIAAVDIILLALRWLWYEQHLSYGGAIFQMFHVYRLVVLPVANTWMGWSLLSKLGVRPGPIAVTALAIAFVGLLAAGLRVRALLHAPLQLASVVFSAASTPQVCDKAFGVEPTGLRCMAAVSLMQFTVGVLLPSIMIHIVDLRVSTAKHYLPHVQAKRVLMHG